MFAAEFAVVITAPLQARCCNKIILDKIYTFLEFFIKQDFIKIYSKNTTKCTWLQYHYLWQNCMKYTTKCII